jgi:hypothetical protein
MRSGAALRERHAADRRGVALEVARVVVLDLVVVPGGEQRVGLAHAQEVRVGVVEPVLVAVLGERLHVAVAIRPGGVGARAGLVVVALVDVVAEADDDVEVLLLGERGVRGVEAAVPLLAGEEADPRRLVGVGGAEGAEAADRRRAVAGEEAVVVSLPGLEPGAAQPRRDRVVARRGRRGAVAGEDGAEVGVGGHLVLDQAGPLELGELRPQRDPVGGRLAGRDALGEDAAAGDLGGALAERAAPVAGERDDAGAGGAGEEVPACEGSVHEE